jgi:hypothetical protein
MHKNIVSWGFKVNVLDSQSRCIHRFLPFYELQANVTTHQQKIVTVNIYSYIMQSFATPAKKRVREDDPFLGRSLGRHVWLKIAKRDYRYMSKQMLVCCLVLVLAPM